MIRLPILLRRQDHKLVYGLLWLPYILLYQLVNRVPIFEPSVLPMSALDRAIPFVPGLLPVYVSYIPFYWWTVARSEDDETATRILYATHLQLFLAVIVWVLFPVSMPRDLFYREAAYGWADAFWRWFDAPNNCLPSLHAANGLLFILFNWKRPGRVLHTLIAVAIIASTVFVKQHYVVDLVGGALLFLVARLFLERLELYEPSASAVPSEIRESDGGLG